MIDYSAIESKWRDRWGKSGCFEADPDDRPKKFITVAYPYPNSPQHIGHGRTYTLADVHARYYRMRGFNVLFPMAFHYTGTPILAMSKKIRERDSETLGVLKDVYGVPAADIAQFAEPVGIADYFHAEIKAGMIEMGYSMDWRREFTTIDPAYQKFTEWQMNALRKKGLIIQGSHPVGWCPEDQNPVSQHDTAGDVEPDFTEYTLVKFALDDSVIPAATLRPETLFGVTNLWVNPEVIYERVTVDDKRWVVSAQCARKLEFLGRRISREGTVRGSELVGKNAVSPHGGEIPILGAGFVEPETGTGLVMSVPAHAPFDWQALHDLKKSGDSAAGGIEPISIITTKGCGKVPAGEMCQKFGIRDQNDPKLEEATSEMYEKEFYGGVMSDDAGKFAGIAVREARDAVGAWLSESGGADSMLEMTNAPVRCRCGAECVVKMLSNQWFLNYADTAWKAQATRCIEKMAVMPQEIRGEFAAVLDWLRERACARQHGLGTRVPWDEEWIVESLSDSVIYMAYYILAKFVNSGAIRAESLSDEFFDYVLLGSGKTDELASACGVAPHTLKEIRAEFEYFYPVDSRHSGRDLVPNHLTFFVLNHVAIFPERHWPGGMVVNGSVLMGGKKMSKSMGNIIPLRQAISEHGADPIRLAIITSAELLQDADFNAESVAGIKNRLEALYDECAKPVTDGGDGKGIEDRWMYGRLSSTISDVTGAIEKMRLREALHSILYSLESDLRWYARRTGAKGVDGGAVYLKVNVARVAMLSPFAPYVAEEMWAKMGLSGMASQSVWPEPAGKPDAAAVQSESLLMGVMEDIAKILKVTGIKPRKITVYTAGRPKSVAYRAVLACVEAGQTDMRSVMQALAGDSETAEIRRDPAFVKKALGDILSEPPDIRAARAAAEIDELDLLSSELPGLVRSELGATLEVFCESDSGIYDPQSKARNARPFKPAILLE